MTTTPQESAATALKRAKKARDFPHNTCPASRHLFLIGETLAKGRPHPMLREQPEHCAETMLSVVAELWELRANMERINCLSASGNDLAAASEQRREG